MPEKNRPLNEFDLKVAEVERKSLDSNTALQVGSEEAKKLIAEGHISEGLAVQNAALIISTEILKK